METREHSCGSSAQSESCVSSPKIEQKNEWHDLLDVTGIKADESLTS